MPFNPGRIIQNKVNTISNIAGDLSSNIPNINRNLTRGLRDVSGSINVLPDRISGLSGDITSTLSGFQNSVAGNLGNLTSGFSSIGGNVANIAQQFSGQLGSQLSGLTGRLDGLAGGLAGNLESLASSIPSLEGLTGQLNSAIASLEDLIPQNFQLLDLVDPRAAFGLNQALGSFTGSLNTTIIRPQGTGKRLANQLETYASYNCIFTLGSISYDSLSNPVGTYKENGPDYVVLRSGGGALEKKVQTAYEKDGFVEYFIDDFEMKTLMAPNSRTGPTAASAINFKVHEPYSMGLFLQALQLAAISATNNNGDYLDCPFLLQLDFVGWDENNNPQIVANSTRHIPMKLVKVTFNVTAGGTVYDVQAMPYNEVAFQDRIQSIPTQASMSGALMHEALQNGENSLTRIINQFNQEIVEAGQITAADLYIVNFPIDRQSGVSSGSAGSASLSTREDRAATELYQSTRGTEAVAVPTGITQWLDSLGVSSIDNQLASTLEGIALGQINEIGQSEILSDFTAGGEPPFALASFAYESANTRPDGTGADIFRRNGVELQISDTSRRYTFDQNTKIQKIIEEMVLLSDYGRNAIEGATTPDGKVPWFRIEAQVYNIPNIEATTQLGVAPKIYVYNVVPYEVDANKFGTPTNPKTGLAALDDQVVKEYNYVYTGNNRDLISFDIQIDAAFYTAIRRDLGNLNGSTRIGAADRVTDTGPPETQSVESGNAGNLAEGKIGLDSATGSSSNGGSRFEDPRTAIARQFHEAIINSNVDLITADLEIWGDPYYLPDSGLGNYNADQGPTINVTSDGTIDYQRSEVDVKINFRTPIDYNPDGSMYFPEDTVAVNAFSGLYQVITAETVISKNQFKNRLKLVRRRNQSVEGAEQAAALVNNGTASSTVDNNASSSGGTVGRPPDDGTRGNGSSNTTPAVPSGVQGSTTTLTTPSGKSFTVATLWADKFQGFVNELENDYGYEIRSIGGYRDTNIAGSNTRSWHSMGLAIDINPTENAHVFEDLENFPTDMPDGISALAAKWGLGWGGDWTSSKDAMHFSAGSNEGGEYTGPRNGLVPGAPQVQQETEETPAATPPANPDANDPRGRDQRNVPDDGLRGSSTTPVAGGRGTVVERQGERAAALLAQQGSGTSNGTTAVSGATRPYTSTQTSGPGLNVRPYIPMDPRDNRYDFNSGDKVITTAQFGQGQYERNNPAAAAPPPADAPQITVGYGEGQVDPALARAVAAQPSQTTEEPVDPNQTGPQ